MNAVDKDHCTLWFEGDWAHCCERHDQAYAAGIDRWTADVDLYLCVAATGDYEIAMLMLIAVAGFGWIAWWLAKRKKENASLY